MQQFLFRWSFSLSLLTGFKLGLAQAMDHFSTIGLPNFQQTGTTEKELVRGYIHYQRELVRLVGDKTVDVPIGVEGGGQHYILWSCRNSGAELWGAVRKQEEGEPAEFGLFDPHFAGVSRVRICLTSQYQRTGFDCDVGFQGQAIPNKDGSSSRFELGFDCPNYGLLKGHVAIPSTEMVQMTAFAHEVAIFDSVEDFMGELSDEPIDPQTEGFSASTQFDRLADISRPSYAVITGHIVEVELKVNGLTKNTFYWALVRTVGGVEIDVVIDPKLIDEGPEPKVGGLITGYFFLSGRLIADRSILYKNEETRRYLGGIGWE